MFEATWQARSTLITQLVSGLAGLSASSDISQGSVATHLKVVGSIVIVLLQIVS